MDQSTMLILGANGQLGKALQAKYPDARALSSDELDISDIGAVDSFDWSAFSVILNAAAYTNVDGAETGEGRKTAWAVNAQAVTNLARVSNMHKLTLVHLSTDYVFDGSQEIHNEDEPLSPLGVYGQSKAAGDIAASIATKHYIIRTSWVIGEGKNFVRIMLDLGKRGITPTVVADQVGRLTFTRELVRAIDHLLTTEAEFGIYNVSNDGESVSWAEIARAVFKEAGLSSTVTDTTTKEYYEGKDGVAPRPLQSTLNLAKLEATGFVSKNWAEDLHEYMQKELAA